MSFKNEVTRTFNWRWCKLSVDITIIKYANGDKIKVLQLEASVGMNLLCNLVS
jgi:hypothetical protein